MNRLVIFTLTSLFLLFTFRYFRNATVTQPQYLRAPTASPTNTLIPAQPPLPPTAQLTNTYHVFQTFNNCGPAALSMALSYFGIEKSQEELGQQLRPYQHPLGDNDDKSVTLAELSSAVDAFGLTGYHRPNGSIELIKRAITQGVPVMARTRLTPNDDIGHYRIIKGYDDTDNMILQDDSLQGQDIRIPYDSFIALWKTFNFEYLIIAPKEKDTQMRSVLEEDIQMITAWNRALERAKKDIEANPQDAYAGLNASVAQYHLGNYEEAVVAYERIQELLPFRTLWYQIEPIQAYFETHNDEKLFALTDRILANQNRAYSELYLVRGKTYLRQGQIQLARSEFEKAVQYNSHLREAAEVLRALPQP